MTDPMITPAQATEDLVAKAKGFEFIKTVPGSTFRDNSTVVVIPTRGKFSTKFHAAFSGLMAPMNGKRAVLYAEGHEVGQAYNALITSILQHPVLSTWKYILTIEDDNLVLPDAHIKLLESIEWGPFDAVSGLYFTKGVYNMPMAYGDPDHFATTGELEFRPRDVVAAVQKGQIMKVNGIAMGCALWRMDLFRQIPPPWFVTLQEVSPEKGVRAFTQDLYFCEKAVRAGKRFAVDMRVKVGHLDIETGEVY